MNARVVPALFRSAPEATLADRHRADQLAAGATDEQVEEALGRAETLTKLAAPALFGDVGKGSEVLPRINKLHHKYADAYQAMNKSSHESYVGDLGSLVRDAGTLIKLKEVCG